MTPPKRCGWCRRSLRPLSSAPALPLLLPQLPQTISPRWTRGSGPRRGRSSCEGLGEGRGALSSVRLRGVAVGYGLWLPAGSVPSSPWSLSAPLAIPACHCGRRGWGPARLFVAAPRCRAGLWPPARAASPPDTRNPMHQPYASHRDGTAKALLRSVRKRAGQHRGRLRLGRPSLGSTVLIPHLSFLCGVLKWRVNLMRG